MCYHEWQDGWEYWKDLYRAQDEIIAYVRKYGRCCLVCKEKYGTIRYEYLFPLTPVSWNYSSNRIRNFIYRWWLRYGNWILRRAIKKVIKKYPHIALELTDDFDWECDI